MLVCADAAHTQKPKPHIKLKVICLNDMLVWICTVEDLSSRSSRKTHRKNSGNYQEELEAILWHAECLAN